MAAASKELAEEEKTEDKKEAEIPKTEDLASMDSLFS